MIFKYLINYKKVISFNIILRYLLLVLIIKNLIIKKLI